ncbi:MAG: proton-conducting transporter membrane subunit, partial [Octadecabacter sp.]
HSTLAAASLFLIVDMVKDSRANLRLQATWPVAGAVPTAALFFMAAIAMAGLPPLSGFLGKLLILDASFGNGSVVWIWSFVLIGSLISVVAFGRAGSTLFWKARSIPKPEDVDPGPAPSTLSYVAVGGLLALLIAHTVFAGPVTAYTTSIAEQLFEPDAYIANVLETPGKLSTPADGGDH